MRRLALVLPFAIWACVPADAALPLGSVEFHYRVSERATEGFEDPELWTVTLDRALLSLDTTTIGQSGNDNRCAYRGRAATRNVVFDVRAGLTQIFNGVEPDDCPDVGFILAPPSDVTLPGPGATGADVVDLAAGEPAHARVVFTATNDDGLSEHRYTVDLRFDTVRTVSRFGGCREAQKGITIVPNQRAEKTITFDAEAFFREALGGDATLRFGPFRDADANGDHVVTMGELDGLPLANARFYSDFYTFEDGSVRGTFGDFVRRQMRYAFTFENGGVCNGSDER